LFRGRGGFVCEFWALVNAKMGEREVLAAMLEVDADLLAERGGILLIADKGFAGAAFEKELAELGITLLRPAASAMTAVRRTDAQEGPPAHRVGQ
jgi:hypothetical protein